MRTPLALSLATFSLAICFSACASTDRASVAADTGPASIAYGYDSALDARAGLVVRDAEHWARVWSEHHRRRLPVPPVPEVDFAREMVLAVTCGERPTGGYGLRIVSAVERDGRLHVLARESRPAAGALLPTVVTTPYALARVPRFAGEVVFQFE